MYRKINPFYCQPNPTEREQPPLEVGNLMHSLDYGEKEFKMFCRFFQEGNVCRRKIELGLEEKEAECEMINLYRFNVVPFPQ